MMTTIDKTVAPARGEGQARSAPSARCGGDRGSAPPPPAREAKGGASPHRLRMYVAVLAVAAICAHLLLRFVPKAPAAAANLPLFVALALGGLPLVYELFLNLLRREFGSDLLAGVSIVTSVLLGEYLAGTLVVLMLSGGQALEEYAVRSASSVLRALAKRAPRIAHRRNAGKLADVPLDQVAVGDELLVFPHEICPVDGVVVEGRGAMDESYLTGEPFRMSKTVGSDVYSGAINGEAALAVRATRRAVDSRYAKIVEVVRASEAGAPRLRRLGDQLGAWYTPLALAVALLAWAVSGNADRFLAVLVVATPCPLLIAIPVAIIGSISLAARRGIIVKKPAALEQVDTCRTLIFDKTGTLTYGEPSLSEVLPVPGFARAEVLSLTAAVERYSKHPLARAVLRAAAAEGLAPAEASEISERPGEGLRGTVGGRRVRITSRARAAVEDPAGARRLPAAPAGAAGLECVVLIDGACAAALRFRDEPRAEGRPFVSHLGPRHHFDRLLLVSGDRASEVQYLADQVGIHEVHAGQSPEQKLAIVRRETTAARTLYLGDGINDAPALLAATVGVALGQDGDVTAEAADAVILDGSLRRVDELFHIGRSMRRIALQSAVGGMALSVLGMALAAAGHLPPVAGAVCQEVIDVFTVLNALRAALPPRPLADF